MHEHLPVLVIVVPLMTALLIPLLSRFGGVRTAWTLVAAALGFSTYASWALLARVGQEGFVRYAMGGWLAPTGIEYVVDPLNAMVLVMVSSVGVLATLWMARGLAVDLAPERRSGYLTVFLLFVTGLMGITITGDVFNLYVFLEISSITSYVLIGMGRRRQALYAGYSYLIVGSIGATFILLGIGYLYQATGTLAMADLAERLPELFHQRNVLTAFAFVTVGLAVKMALFPLHGWQPSAYSQAPAGASIFLAATATKVSAYTLYRFVYTIYGPRFLIDVLPTARDLILVSACAGIVFGPLLALRQSDLKRLLAYSSVGQIGTIVLGVVLLDPAGTAGGILHMWNHAAAKGALFCVAGALAFGVSMAVLAVSPNLWVAFPVAAVLGASSIAFMTSSTAIVQLLAGPEFRGRVLAIQAMVFLGSTPIGGPIVGWISEAAGPRVGIVVGALSCLVAAGYGAKALDVEPVTGEVEAVALVD